MMTEQMNVLIPIDGSENSSIAFDWYAKTIYQPDHHVILLYVAEYPNIPTIDAGALSPDLWQKLMDKRNEGVQELKKEYAKKMENYKISGEIKAVFGHTPGESIVNQMTSCNTQLVVMGSRGLGTLRRTIMGSVSDYVLHHSCCPVMIHKK